MIKHVLLGSAIITAGMAGIIGYKQTHRPPVPQPLVTVEKHACTVNQGLPDPICTPGVVNPKVTQDNIQKTICVSGYTKTIRPPVSYTNKLKLEQMKEYGLDGNPSNYEEDHLISLELGGSPDDPKNLWPEFPASPNAKDHLENVLHTLVCNKTITLEEAQQSISSNWIKAYEKYAQ